MFALSYCCATMCLYGLLSTIVMEFAASQEKIFRGTNSKKMLHCAGNEVPGLLLHRGCESATHLPPRIQLSVIR